jgi:hypothetical protein
MAWIWDSRTQESIRACTTTSAAKDQVAVFKVSARGESSELTSGISEKSRSIAVVR